MSWQDPVEDNLAELARVADDVTPLLSFPADYPAERRQEILARIAMQRRISRHIFRGYLANWRRQLQAGTREYRKALKLDPHDEGVKFALGVSTWHKHQALAALARHPADTKALSKLGYIAWNEQQYDTAIGYFQRVLQYDAQQAAAYVHLGVNYAAQERFDASIAAYQEAGRRNADLASLVQQSIQLVQHLQRAKEHPDDSMVHFQLGGLYSADGRSDRALEAFEKVAALAPHLPHSFLHLAVNYEAEGRDAEALQAYRRVLELAPDHVQARNNAEKLALKMALEQGQPTQVSVGDGLVLDISPDDAMSYYHLGLRYLRNGEAEAAVAALHQAVLLRPDFASAYSFLGLAYATLGAPPKAEMAYRQALALDPTDAQAYNALGLVYQHQQRYRKAIAMYRQAIARAPDYALAYANLAASYEALGKVQSALTAYRQAWERDSSLAFAREKIEALRRPGRQ
jgi:tetratricopeptide (TPR) repeat protein